MMRSRLVLALALFVVGCDSATNDTFRPPPLATLRGTMTARQGLTLGGAVRLSVLWFTSEGGRPGSLLGVVADEVAYTGTFPQAYSLALDGLPPGNTLRADDAGTVGAAGVIVAYEDLNGDGQLTLARGGPVVDRVLGTSSRAFVSAREGVVEPVSQYLLYLDTVGAAYAGQAQPGYQLQTATIENGGFTSTAVIQPLTATTVPLELTGAPELALLACGELYDALGTPEYATRALCGVGPRSDAPGPMALTGTIAISGDAGFADLTLGALLLDGGVELAPGAMDASVSLNGVPLRSTRPGQFSLFELQATIVREENVVRVQTSQAGAFERRCTIPRVDLVIPPSVRGGQPATLSWTAQAQSTVVALLGGQSALTPATSVTAVAPLDAGVLTYTVSASAQPPLAVQTLGCSRLLTGSIPIIP